MPAFFRLLRIKHWIKNFVIFLPAFFGGVFFEVDNVIKLLLVFIVFSLTASAIYIFNDLLDYENDKLHPSKKNRPIASGKISKSFAWTVLLALLIISAGFAYIFDFGKGALIVLGIYFVNNILYTIFLKKVPIIEFLIVAIGFVLRILIGAFSIDVQPSKWIIIVTFFVALYLIITKRRGEFVNNKTTSREVLKSYNLSFLDAAMYMSLTASMISYLMYSVEINLSERFQTDYIYITTVFIVIILLRHLQQTLVFGKTESPISYFYSDVINFVAIIGFLLTFYFLIY